MNYKILIVDDEPANLRTMERLFRSDYEVLTAGSGAAALELIRRFDIALIISDQRMPGMSGIEFLKQAAAARPQTVRIILSSYTDVVDLVEAINSGVIYKYMTKPWINSDLRQTVQRAIEHYEAAKRQLSLLQENQRLRTRIEQTTKGFTRAVNELIAQKDPDIAAHCRRTARYAALIGERMDLDAEEIENLAIAGAVHEISRWRLQIDIDLDKRPIVSEEYRTLRNSFETGLRLIGDVPDMADVVNIIRFQYEHFNGTGYFAGLDGDAIPLGSRILAVANAFDEINSGRRPEYLCTDEEAADWLRARSGTEFDPVVVEICLETNLIDRNPFLNPERLSERFAALAML